MKIKAGFKKILTEYVKSTEQSAGGIYMPEQTQHTQMVEATVVAANTENGGIEPGDRVVFHRNHSNVLMHGEKKFMVLEEHAVLLVIEKD